MTTVEEKNVAPDWGKAHGISELWTEVADGLWVGGTADEDIVSFGRKGGTYGVSEDAEIGPSDFDSVATLYAWARPVDWLVEEYRWGIFDGGSYKLDLEDVKDMVSWVHKRWKNDKKVLVRCQAGLSRSTFITALVLVRDGMSVDQAVNLIRYRRSDSCLRLNGSSKGGIFSGILYETPEEYWRD